MTLTNTMGTTIHSSYTRSAVTALDERGDRTDLSLADGRVVSVPVAVNRSSASRLRAGVKRLAAVEIDTERLSAVAVGTGFRRPFRRPIPVSMALGLIAAGVPGLAR